MAPRWGMVVDVNRCVGCQTCTVACKHQNDTAPDVQWRRVLDIETGSYPDVARLFLVTGCQHCAEPPCVPVCPTGATKQRLDGLVTMDYDTCIGCGACAVACPYQARTIVHDRRWYFGEATVQEAAAAHDERLGVAQKCTFCIEKVDDGLAAGLVPGSDAAATPACAASCIASAITFGDFNDSASLVSRLTADSDYVQMHPELGTDPMIRYKVATPAVPARAAGPEEVVPGPQQTFWDIRAAMNFVLGGIGAGTAIMAYLLSLAGGISQGDLILPYAVAGAIMAVGLFCVWLKIGRPLRAPLAVLRPQSSWMTRELYAAWVFYLVLLADWVAPSPWFDGAVALAAVAFLVCQARILFASKGIPAWRAAEIPSLLIVAGLAEGVGVLAIMGAVLPMIVRPGALGAATGMVLAMMAAYRWFEYIDNSRAAGIEQDARAVLHRLTPWLLSLGYGVPFLLYGVFLFNGGPWLAAAAGGVAIAAGIVWKSAVILRAGHFQGFALPKLPQRGSGRYAAPVRGAI
jgi:phenylacetyl-CoA:acceptor oxidoreductase subunit 1